MRGERFEIRYGDASLTCSIPESASVRTIMPADAPGIPDLRNELHRVLEDPTASCALSRLVRPGDRVVILVSDITRLWVRTSEFLPHVLDYLNRAGVPDGGISVIIAKGSHREMTAEEHRLIVGDSVYRRVRVSEHSCDADSELVFLGRTSRGTPVAVNRTAIEADRLILTGGIVHHAMSGYGGGPKTILPGIASRATIKANHIMALAEDAVDINPAAGAATTRGNPLHEDMVEAASLVQPDFLINAVTNAQGELAFVTAGHWLEAWRAGCQYVDRLYLSEIDHKADVVVASCGGYPLDISLYQASKSLYNASRALEEGGSLVLAVEAREGGGGEGFFDWYGPGGLEGHYHALRRDFTVAGYLAFLIALIARRMHVILVTSLSEEDVARIGACKAATLQQAVETALARSGEAADVLVMPRAGLTLPVIARGT